MLYILTMEKEALLSIIINNLKEVETLVETFKGKPSIPPAFIRLTLQKVESIREEISLLQNFNEEPSSVPTVPKPETITASTVPNFEWTAEPEKEIGNSAVKIAAEESHSHINVPTPVVDTAQIPLAPEPKKQTTAPVSATPKTEPQRIEESPQSKVNAELISQKPKPSPTIGELLAHGKATVVDRITASKELANQVAIGKPVDDIRKAIGINDRFLYQRELFDGNASRMDQTIDELNRLSTFHEAHSFIRSNFNWEEDNATVESFMNNVQRRFI